MDTPFVTSFAIIALGLLFVVVPLAVHTFQRYRYKKVLRCPETGGFAEVDFHASRAAVSSALGRPRVRIRSCSLWPRRKNCVQACVKQ